ncbi:MAG: iron complex transport system permease protein, partial [Euryarchaeota archaeon]|nr:iron complex transport system permease protein [Euryarchaeota archaeon]
MHFADGAVPEDYLVYVRRKYFWIMGGLLLLFFMLIYSISVGAVEIPLYKVVETLSGQEATTKWDENIRSIIW